MVLISTEGFPAVVNHGASHRDDEVLNTSSAIVLLKKCYALEFSKSLHDPSVRLSRDNQWALDIQYTTVHYFGDRYEVGVLWKHDDMVLPNNYAMAFTCLNHLCKCLLNEPPLLAKYQAYIQRMIDCGQAVVDRGDSDVSPRT